MSEGAVGHSNLARSSAMSSIAGAYPYLVQFLTSPEVGRQLESQGFVVDWKEIVRLFLDLKPDAEKIIVDRKVQSR